MVAAIKVIYTISDEKGKSATTEVKVPNGFLLTQYTEFAQGMAQFIDATVGGKVTSANFCVGVDLTGLGLKALAQAGSDIEEKGFWQWLTAGGFRTRMQIPTWLEALVNTGSDDINRAQADVLALETAMLTGIAVTGPATIQPCDEREDDIQSTQFAREHFRASGSKK